MDKLSIETKKFDDYLLEKHTYPKWIRILFVGIFCVFISIVPSFLIRELPYHYILNQQITSANEYYHNQNYDNALQLYSKLLSNHPYYKQNSSN